MEIAHKVGRVWTHDGQQRLDGVKHTCHAPEGERSRTETDDLTIVPGFVATDYVDRIRGRIDMIEGAVQSIEGSLQTGS
jgi:hypothetical protein